MTLIIVSMLGGLLFKMMGFCLFSRDAKTETVAGTMAVTRATRMEISEHLLSLSLGYTLPENAGRGICDELLSKYGVLIPKTYFASWANFSGNFHYPVRHGNAALSPKDGYRASRDLWGSNQYGDQRRALCEHLARCYFTNQSTTN